MLIRSLLFYADAGVPGTGVLMCMVLLMSNRSLFIFNGSAAIRDETFERFFIVLRQLSNTLIVTWFVCAII